ncbi:MAG TPA: YtxH domain-containing protein, partial [Candidatus Saccharimonadales bacterium]|nr:YtxH domain-containing protein [Candidatus Saccharimonadales bacterium]
MSDNSHSDLTVAFAFLAGTLVGAGVALLMAPRPGAETREQVGEWIQYLQRRVKEAARRGEDAEDAEAEAGD